MKKKVFDDIMLLERLTEEESILLEEMKQHWNYLTRACRALSDQAGELSNDLATQSYPSGLSPKAYHGLQSAVLQKLEELKTETAAVKTAYQEMVICSSGETVEENEYPEDEDVFFADDDDDADNDSDDDSGGNDDDD